MNDDHQNTTIRVIIEEPPLVRGQRISLLYTIGRRQAEDLVLGPVPPAMDMWAIKEWDAKMARAQKMAELIASDVAHGIIRALNAPKP